MSSYPETQKIDVEFLWNPDVLHQEYVDEATLTDSATTTDLLCDNTFSYPAELPATSSYDET